MHSFVVPEIGIPLDFSALTLRELELFHFIRSDSRRGSTLASPQNDLAAVGDWAFHPLELPIEVGVIAKIHVEVNFQNALVDACQQLGSRACADFIDVLRHG
jgi:hypothetical protein